MTVSSLAITRDRTAIRSIARSGLVVAIVDGTWAVVLWTLILQRATAAQVFLGVARALLGPDAREAGAPGVALGVALHLSVATAWSAVYLLLLRAWPSLRRLAAGRAAPLVGMAYGPLVWLAMDLVVVPLTRARHTPPGSPMFYVNLVAHMFVVGLPIALLMRDEARR